MVNIMKNLKNAVIIGGVAYTINETEAKKIAQLLNISAKVEVKAEAKTEVKKADKPKAQPKAEKQTRVVGSLEQDGKYVRTMAGMFLNGKVRYAIKMSAEELGATKLAKGNKVYDSLAKLDKYVQVYEFKTVADANKFMDAQQSRLAK